MAYNTGINYRCRQKGTANKLKGRLRKEFTELLEAIWADKQSGRKDLSEGVKTTLNTIRVILA